MQAGLVGVIFNSVRGESDLRKEIGAQETEAQSKKYRI